MKRLNLHNPLLDAPVYYIEETESTMTDAKSLLLLGEGHGTVVVAGYQRAGRGRFSHRKWESEPGDGLLMTVIISASRLVGGVSLLPSYCGLAVGRAIQSYCGTYSKIKWPNDVLIAGRKVAGILCERKDNMLLVGIGINCRKREFNGHRFGYQPTSLGNETHKGVQALDLLEPVLAEIHRVISGPVPLLDVENQLYLLNETVEMVVGLPEDCNIVTGMLSGLANDGQLIVTEPVSGKRLRISSGEIVSYKAGQVRG